MPGVLIRRDGCVETDVLGGSYHMTVESETEVLVMRDNRCSGKPAKGEKCTLQVEQWAWDQTHHDFRAQNFQITHFFYLRHLVFNALLWHLRKLMQLAFPILKTSNDGLLYPLWQSSSKRRSATNFTSRSLLNIHIAWHIYLKLW